METRITKPPPCRTHHKKRLKESQREQQPSFKGTKTKKMKGRSKPSPRKWGPWTHTSCKNPTESQSSAQDTGLTLERDSHHLSKRKPRPPGPQYHHPKENQDNDSHVKHPPPRTPGKYSTGIKKSAHAYRVTSQAKYTSKSQSFQHTLKATEQVGSIR